MWTLIERIPIKRVQPGMVAADEVFRPDDNLPVVQRGTELTRPIIERLHSHGVTHVLVDLVDEAQEETKPEELLIPEAKPIISETLRDEAVSGIRRMFDAVGGGAENMTTAYQVVKEVNAIVDQLVDTLTESNSLIHITDLKSHDEYTYHHSLSVAVLSIAIGQSLGLSDSQLKVVGRCAMLHDIGKVLVPVNLINKPGRLSHMEFFVVKQHPRKGYEYLSKGVIENEILRQGVLCHHEKVNGTGYPKGLKGKDIPLISRIIAVADVYDAVTSYRSYRKPMSPSEAVELVMSEVGRAFDYDIVQAFISKLQLYPINSYVELSDKRCGIVINNTSSMRPVIKIVGTGEMVDLMDFDNLSLIITCVSEDNDS